MTQEEVNALTPKQLEEQAMKELHAVTGVNRQLPTARNITVMNNEERAKLQFREREVVTDEVTDRPTNGRLRRYLRGVHSEDYTNTDDQCTPNASMSVVDIFRRLSQGKPIYDTNYTDYSSSRDAGYDSTAKDRDISLQELWDAPYTQPLGTLERVQETADRYRQTLDYLNMRKQEQAQAQAQNEQDIPAPSEATSVGYEQQRAAAKKAKEK